MRTTRHLTRERCPNMGESVPDCVYILSGGSSVFTDAYAYLLQVITSKENLLWITMRETVLMTNYNVHSLNR